MNRITKTVTAMAVSALTCFAAGTAAFAASPSDEELSALSWGMTAEEVEAVLTTAPDNTERTESAGTMQNLYTYEGVELNGYSGYLIVCASDEFGLDGINYHFATDDPYGLYTELSEHLKAEGGIYDPTTDEFSFWHFDDKNYTVMLFNLGTEVQYSYFPLFAEEDRGYNYDSGIANEAEDIEVSEQPVKDSPDTGIADAAVVTGIVVLAAGVLIFTYKKQ